MEITIKCEVKEIAALAALLQKQQSKEDTAISEENGYNRACGVARSAFYDNATNVIH